MQKITAKKMQKPIGYSIEWCALDVKSARPNWSDFECLTWIEENSKRIHDACIIAGNETIEILTNEEYE